MGAGWGEISPPGPPFRAAALAEVGSQLLQHRTVRGVWAYRVQRLVRALCPDMVLSHIQVKQHWILPSKRQKL